MEYEIDCKDSNERPPLYFPQPEDECPSKLEQTTISFDPWATGKLNCSLRGGVTGLRPVTDKYSITRFGPSEWRAHNLKVFQQSDEKIYDAETAASSAKECVERSYKATDKTQLEATERLKARAELVYRFKAELEFEIAAVIEEIRSLEAERCRVKRSLSVLTIPESIASEFLQLRSSRMEPDLVRDAVEEQLIKEIALCSEIRDLLNRTHEQIRTQMDELKTAKARLESDWSDKMHTYNIESVCVNLSNDSPLLMWKPGSTRSPADQSTPASYEYFTQEGLTTSETARQRSTDLRLTVNALYTDFVKNLRDQATRVDVALEENVKLMQDVLWQLENELLRCLQKLADTEKLIEELRSSTKGLNNAMKLAQTRLDNRLLRRNVENCHDAPQFTLIEEVKSLGERTSTIVAELKRTEESQQELIKARNVLELQIMVKRKTLYIDKERGQTLRSYFPSSTALSGF